MKQKQMIQRLLVTMMVFVMVATSVNAMPVSAEEVATETKTDVLFEATFDADWKDLVTYYGFTGSNDAGFGTANKFDAFTASGYMYMQSAANWGVRNVWKSVTIPKGETLVIEFDARTTNGDPGFRVGIMEPEPANGVWNDLDLYCANPSEWTRIKIEIAFEKDGAAVSNTYTKSLAEENAEYVAVEGYKDVSISADYAADGITNVYFAGVGSNTEVLIDNVDIYTTHAYKNGKCTVCGDYKDDTAALAGYSLTLDDGTIGLNYYMEMNDAIDLSTVEMRFIVDGVSQTVSYADSKPDASGKYQIFTCEVFAKQMAKDIRAVVYNNGVVGSAYTYSVKQYAEKILADETTYAKEIPVVQAMLNYGSYAQEYFGYDVENLANGGTYLGDKALSTVTTDTLAQYTGNTVVGDDNVKLTSTSLILESKTNLRLYLSVAEGVTVEGLKQSGNGYYVEKTEILPQNLTDDVTVSVLYDEQSVDVTYNCMSYCYNVLNSTRTSDELKDLVRALYLYGQSAEAYVAD